MRLKNWNRSLSGSLVYSLLGTAFYLITQLGVLSGLSHFKGPIAVGEFGLALALTTPLFALANMGLRTQQTVDVTRQFTFPDYGGVRLLLTTLAVASCLVAGWLLAGDSHTLLVLVVITGAKAFESVSSLAYGAFQQEGRMDLVARSYFVRGSLTLVCFLGLLANGADTIVAFLSQFVVWGLVAMLLDYRKASRLATGQIVKPRISRECWRLILKSAPLSGASFANNLQGSLPRLFIQWHLGLEQLGLFTAVGYFQRGGLLISNSVLQAIVNRLAHLNHNNERKAAYKILLWLSIVFIAFGAIGIYLCIVLGEQLLRLIFGESFVAAYELLIMVSIALVLRMLATLVQSMLLAKHRFGAYFGTQTATLAVTVPLAYYLIAIYGLMGAGYALVAASAFRLLAVIAIAISPKSTAAPDSQEVVTPVSPTVGIVR